MDWQLLVVLSPYIVQASNLIRELSNTVDRDQREELIIRIVDISINAFEAVYGRDVINNTKVANATRAVLDLVEDLRDR